MLDLTARIHKLPSPNSRCLSFLQDWLSRPDRGNSFLRDVEAKPWDSSYGHDHVVLCSKVVGDQLASHIRAAVVPWYHKFFGWLSPPVADEEIGEIWQYTSERIIRFGDILCMFLSSAIPVVSIVALYFVENMLIRFVMISIFCLIFSGALVFIVGSRRADVFAATTAFAAIQAVFVGGISMKAST